MKCPLYLAVLVGTLQLTISNSGLWAAAEESKQSLVGTVVDISLPENPTSEQIRLFPGLPEPLVPMGDPDSDPATSALGAAINAWQKAKTSDDFSALEKFVSEHPKSVWVPALTYNLGRLYYSTGYFSRAIDSFQTSW